MTRTTLDEMKACRLAGMTPDERDEFDSAYAATKLTFDVAAKVRSAREEAGLTQRQLATRMATSQAAIARLEAGAAAPTLTTLQKVADALGLDITVELHASDA